MPGLHIINVVFFLLVGCGGTRVVPLFDLIALSIAKNYYPPSKRKNRTDWESNPDLFMGNFHVETQESNRQEVQSSLV